MSNNFAIINLGCKVNRVESDYISSKMSAYGREVSSVEADIIFVNTCTVTAAADKKTRKAVSKALRENESAKVVVTGCSASIHADYYRSLSNRIEVVDKFELWQKLSNSSAPITSNMCRIGVKIQDGCDNACTYCIVCVARGKSKSIPRSEVIKTCIDLDRTSVPEIVLSGINIGSYNDGSLVELLRDLLASTNNCRYRISSIEPNDVTHELIDLVAGEERICDHFHLPLQSGSDKVLKEMNRPYSSSDFKCLVDKIYSKIPNFSISTDVIVGFPGESDAEFEETYNFCKYCNFTKIHVFPYSMRQGTIAAARPDQIDYHTKQSRAKTLRELSKKLRLENFNERVGTFEMCVIEDNHLVVTDSYFTLKDPSFTDKGTLKRIQLEKDMFFE